MTSDLVRDLLALVGYVLVVAGVAMLSVPAGFIVAGGLLLAVVVWPEVYRMVARPSRRESDR